VHLWHSFLQKFIRGYILLQIFIRGFLPVVLRTMESEYEKMVFKTLNLFIFEHSNRG